MKPFCVQLKTHQIRATRCSDCEKIINSLNWNILHTKTFNLLSASTTLYAYKPNAVWKENAVHCAGPQDIKHTAAFLLTQNIVPGRAKGKKLKVLWKMSSTCVIVFYFPFVRLQTRSIESAGFVSPLRMTALALQKNPCKWSEWRGFVFIWTGSGISQD